MLFPRLPFGYHACKVATFPCLQSLDLRSRNPLTGIGEQSATAGQQFLSAMKSLKNPTIQLDAGSQVLLKTLYSSPAVHAIRLLRSAFPKLSWVTILGDWQEWAERRQIRTLRYSLQNPDHFPAIPIGILRASGVS